MPRGSTEAIIEKGAGMMGVEIGDLITDTILGMREAAEADRSEGALGRAGAAQRADARRGFRRALAEEPLGRLPRRDALLAAGCVAFRAATAEASRSRSATGRPSDRPAA